MKEEKENGIDKLFRGGLQNSEDNISYQDEDWDKLEGMLNGEKPKGIVRSIVYLIGVVAAMLLLVIGWLFFAPGHKPAVQPQVVKTQPQVKKDSGIYGSPSQQLADRKNTLSDSAQTNNGAVDNIRTSNPFFTLSARDGDRTATGFTPVNGTQNAVSSPAKPDTIITHVNNDIASNAPVKPDTVTEASKSLAANTAIKKDTVTDGPLKLSSKPANTLATVTDDIKVKKVKIRSAGVGFKPALSLGIVASPDINSVKTFSDNKVGTNAGLLLTLNVSKKWSVSTGAVYSDKPYNADFASYQTNYVFKTTPTSVTASCMVLDIPVNVGYQLYSKNRNKFSVGTGLSSYFMLRENYTFNHATGDGYNEADPWHYNIKNQNQHLFGILNLNATYQREVSSKLDIGIQPYMKLPLTGIGYGQVNLRSAGVAVSVMYNFKTGTKPK